MDLRTVNELLAGSVGGAAQVLGTTFILAGVERYGKKGFLPCTKVLIHRFSAVGRITERRTVGMASPLIGIAGVNSLLFAAYGASKRIISPFPQLSLKETAAAGALAGAVNAVLASPVEMFKVRMQGQYGAKDDKRLRDIAKEMWAKWGFRKGVMRGYWLWKTKTRNPDRRSTAFEYSKRKFGKTYGQQLPVWALLASGSTGGVHVIKSRIQLRPTPPSGTPVQYIAHEFKAILAESGLYVFDMSILVFFNV
ncbi:hypothetical protein PHLCEN_2v7015 [Hermanssonia centrifuga]|uniref:Mitochondrial carrier protein n=1 Tax=Hermanssonia centrifuga TaxID=98765 RepID=A0A2R6NXQ6_9APHY|nr:hypothetical protein PHLCEN_2v7015 [Hermanssonia centrifuga]